MGDSRRTGGTDPGERVERTPEERAAFEERMETLGDFVDIMDDERQGVRDQAAEDMDQAHAEGRGVGRIWSIADDKVRILAAVLLLLIVIMVLAYFLFYERGIDVTEQLDGGSAAGSAEVQSIAPPEPAATPAEVLPPELFPALCADCGESVTQVPLELNTAAKYQFAYESGGSRVAIFTVLDAEQYDSLAASADEAYSQALDEGREVDAPKYLDDVGDAAVVYDGMAVFKKGDDCGIISSNVLVNADGEQFVTISNEELEHLARAAAPRM